MEKPNTTWRQRAPVRGMLCDGLLIATAPSHVVAFAKPDSCALYSRRCPARVAHHDFGPSRRAAAIADTAASAAERVRVQAGRGTAPAASPWEAEPQGQRHLPRCPAATTTRFCGQMSQEMATTTRVTLTHLAAETSAASARAKSCPRSRERSALLKAVNVAAVMPGRLSCPDAALPLAVPCPADGRPRASQRRDGHRGHASPPAPPRRSRCCRRSAPPVAVAPSSGGYRSPLIHSRRDLSVGRVCVPSCQTALRPPLAAASWPAR